MSDTPQLQTNQTLPSPSVINNGTNVNNINKNSFNLRTYLTVSRILNHFGVGFLSGWIGASLLPILFFHFIVELYSNSAFGIDLNNRLFGTKLSDRVWQESLMDNVLFVIGWLIAQWLVKNNKIVASPLLLLGIDLKAYE